MSLAGFPEPVPGWKWGEKKKKRRNAVVLMMGHPFPITETVSSTMCACLSSRACESGTNNHAQTQRAWLKTILMSHPEEADSIPQRSCWDPSESTEWENHWCKPFHKTPEFSASRHKTAACKSASQRRDCIFYKPSLCYNHHWMKPIHSFQTFQGSLMQSCNGGAPVMLWGNAEQWTE